MGGKFDNDGHMFLFPALADYISKDLIAISPMLATRLSQNKVPQHVSHLAGGQKQSLPNCDEWVLKRADLPERWILVAKRRRKKNFAAFYNPTVGEWRSALDDVLAEPDQLVAAGAGTACGGSYGRACKHLIVK